MNWSFDWKDEDPGALIVLVLGLLLVLLVPWHSCTSTAPLTGNAIQAKAPAAATQAAPTP